MQTAPNAVLFTFSIIFFSIMTETGVFQPLVNWLTRIAGNNIIAIVMVTGVIATVAHLDGSSVPSVLITIGAMLPVYKHYKLRPTVLLCMLAAGMGALTSRHGLARWPAWRQSPDWMLTNSTMS